MRIKFVWLCYLAFYCVIIMYADSSLYCHIKYNILKVQTTRFFDFHWPITLTLVWIFQIFRSAITFWVIWSTYLSKFALIGCYINFQKLKNRVRTLKLSTLSHINTAVAWNNKSNANFWRKTQTQKPWIYFLNLLINTL